MVSRRQIQPSATDELPAHSVPEVDGCARHGSCGRQALGVERMFLVVLRQGRLSDERYPPAWIFSRGGHA